MSACGRPSSAEQGKDDTHGVGDPPQPRQPRRPAGQQDGRTHEHQHAEPLTDHLLDGFGADTGTTHRLRRDDRDQRCGRAQGQGRADQGNREVSCQPASR